MTDIKQIEAAVSAYWREEREFRRDMAKMDAHYAAVRELAVKYHEERQARLLAALEGSEG